MNIGNIKIEGIASLAPMAGIGDKAFREICIKFGSAYVTSEMISVKGIIYNSEKTFHLMEHSKSKVPFAIQLFGNNPKDFYEAVKIIENKLDDIDIIDVNMGCPATKIVKEDSGSALMKKPDICGEIIHNIKKACNLPLTVKIRAGWDNNSINACEVAKICEQAGVNAITVHGRTKSQGYSGQNNLEIIKKVKESVKIPIIGNGDITDVESAKKMLDYTKCDLITIGRSSIGNPWIFSEINNYFKDKNLFLDINLEKKFDIIKLHLEKVCKYKGENTGIKEFRKHFASYIKGLKNASKLRSSIFSLNTKKEIFDFLSNIDTKN